jgi:hypothetical protein
MFTYWVIFRLRDARDNLREIRGKEALLGCSVRTVVLRHLDVRKGMSHSMSNQSTYYSIL